MKENSAKTGKVRLSLGTILCLTMCLTLSALEPPTPEQVARYKADGSWTSRQVDAEAFGNHRVSPRLVHDFRARVGAAQPARPESWPPDGWVVFPSIGNSRTFTLLLAFEDYAPANSPATIHSQLFEDGEPGYYPEESMRNFYRRASYGLLEIEGNTLGWYTTPYPRSQVEESRFGRENLIKEAIAHFDAQGHDFSQYDNSGDGLIEYFLVIWTGPHGEWAEFWWGYQTFFNDRQFVVDGKRLTNYSWQWESYYYPGPYDSGVCIHETGHALGLPDYYDYDDDVGPRGGVGNLDIMDGWGDHNCASKTWLGWLEPTPVAGMPSEFTLRAAGGYPEALVLLPRGEPFDPFSEYFMVQNRYRTGNDVQLPGDGLIIWHVDARLGYDDWFLYDNSYTEHKLLRLMEADGLEEIEQGYNADAGDYYTSNDSIGPYTHPDSRLYDGTVTGIAVDDIGANGPSMTFTASARMEAVPPSVTNVQKAGGPFRIKVYGSEFQQGLAVYVGGEYWGDTSQPTLVKYMNEGLIVIKKGDALKAKFPKEVFVPIRIVNPGGGEITVEFDRKTKAWRMAE